MTHHDEISDHYYVILGRFKLKLDMDLDDDLERGDGGETVDDGRN